ncbi:cation-translocating P-type ATPase [Streptococcus pluranimalium]|uniref:ATPase n=1 Tax=Streptococcus pluranimalium TaxID=82348 RepID=A0A2L0D4Q7_9STRE|nr:HAD-IC family P-type ATPase [Streptococcus pluranimalium]AUW96822.1 ATPase [Streptococcus pluranimalium]MDY3042063.1 HAD-IC family P-type ATPase [Streptococcus pluranimalium]HEM6116323.1 HAD-IC family P-type ATPase [Streptococcus suis]
MEKNYQKKLDDIIQSYEVDVESGLTKDQVRHQRDQYGENILEENDSKSPFEILLENLNNIIVYLLGFAMILSFMMGEWIEGIAVFLALLISILTGFFVELKAQKSVDALQKMVTTHVTVLREGVESDIESSELVPGDVMILNTGDAIAADGRLIKANNLAVIESALTGESEAVDKDAAAIFEEEVPVGDRLNMVFSGTSVTRGQGLALVTGTGMDTEVGKISDMMSGKQDSNTPLDKEISKLGKSLILLAIVAAVLVVVIGLINGQALTDILHIAIILAVAAIPEAMPAVQTITLSNGMKTMATHQALVKTLSAVETLGSTSVIASDKTGTLTENQMMVEVISSKTGDDYKVSGSGYVPEGEISKGNQAYDIDIDETFINSFDSREVSEESQLKAILLNAFLSSNARLEASDDDEGEYSIKGDPTDGALKVLGYKGKLTPEKLSQYGFEKVNEIPFDSENKYMAVCYQWPDKRTQFILKGAPDVLLSLIKADEETNTFWQNNIDEIAEKGMRSLALASTFVSEEDRSSIEQNMPDWLAKHSQKLEIESLFGIVDPPRKDVAKSIQQTQEAGIRIKMITGDHPKTASMIAKDIGIDHWENTMTGAEIDQEHDQDGFIERVHDTAVFARVSPENKLQLVEALQAHGEIVAMTGDGVNDAPALNGSNIGVAMGIRGTEVAKEASDMILTDDRFSTIVDAVREGRIIFENIKKYVSFLFACNMVEISAILFTIIFLLPMPIQPLHILWLNLLIDVGPAIALAYETAEEDVMQRPPRDAKSGLVNVKFLSTIIFSGIAIGITAFGLFYYLHIMSGESLAYAQTATFTFMTIAQLAHIFNVRRQKGFGLDRSLFQNKLLILALCFSLIMQVMAIYLPFFNDILGTQALRADTLLILLLASLAITALVYLITKVIRKTAA